MTRGGFETETPLQEWSAIRSRKLLKSAGRRTGCADWRILCESNSSSRIIVALSVLQLEFASEML
jgi:hypothetical protein